MSRRGASLLLVALLTAAGIVLARPAAADASGCIFYASSGAGNGPDGVPNCQPGGEGCYECAYSYRDKPGYDICSENVNGSSQGCDPNQPSIPDWWPDPVPTDPGPPGDLPPDTVTPGTNGNDEGPDDQGGGSDPPPEYLYMAEGGPIFSPIHSLDHAPYRPHAPYQPPEQPGGFTIRSS